MVSKKELINELGKDFEPMLKNISIADFTKCIAQYSGIDIRELKDDVIKQYLLTWARNKRRLFDFLGDIKVDFPIDWVDTNKDYSSKILEIGREFLGFYPWLKGFSRSSENKINPNEYDWNTEAYLEEAFPDYKWQGVSLTHFFKSKLNAPDELVTALGRIWENTTMHSTFTISIDPVDIMLSSENPYGWVSCYRLENDGFEDSHADGCLAGVLDTSTLITYIWDKHGKYDLYGYDLKDVRYKRIRMTIATNKEFNAIHFNKAYPSYRDYTDEFLKEMREKVETFFSEKLGKSNIWERNEEQISCRRVFSNYGYSEYEDDYVYLLKGEDNYSNIFVYDTPIICPCGCGDLFIGTSEQDGEYDGYGLTNENFNKDRHYCEYADDYCECTDCTGCRYWNLANAVCSLNEQKICTSRNLWDAEDAGDADFDSSCLVKCNPEYCKGCLVYEFHRITGEIKVDK